MAVGDLNGDGYEDVLTFRQHSVGAEAWLAEEPNEGLDGGFAVLPRAFTLSPSRSLLERAIQALQGLPNASLDGSAAQAAIDAHPGACAIAYFELATLRRLFPEEPSTTEAERPKVDPFEATLTADVQTTGSGLVLRMRTR